MKKKLLAALLAVLMLTGSAMAYTTDQQNTADALNHLRLFLGTGTERGYDLDAKLNRHQGVILLVRMLGMEDEAKTGKYSHTFKGVPAGATAHVAYAYSNGIVNGYTATDFGGSDVMTDKMFLALSLRALGYTDKGENKDFEYANSRRMAYSIGLVDDPAYDSNFTRGEAVEVFWRILGTKFKGQDKTLGDQLMEQGVITKAELTKAADIQKNGKAETGNSSGGSSSSGAVSGGSSSGGSSSGNTSGSGSTSGKTEYTWEEYQALTPAEQKAYYKSFENVDDYFDWYDAAKAAYDAAHPSIEIGSGGSIDLGELAG